MRSVSVFFVTLLFAVVTTQAQISNEAITEYIRSAVASGKTEQQIGKELIARGVTLDQLKQIKRQYEQLQSNTTQSATDEAQPNSADVDGRIRHDEISPVGQPEGSDGSYTARQSDIFGHDVFTAQNMSFEPNENAATPASYRLGPGDEVLVDIWGASEANFKLRVTPEGMILIPQVGAIPLSGLTMKQATEKIRRTVARRYAGLNGGNTQISVTLGQIRTINVHMMGEVAVPGTYRLSSFSSLFNALYRAGGVTDAGSLRNVQLVRDGETIDTVDVYRYLFYGTTDSDISLQDGDVVIVPPYEQLVTMTGQVKRPMRYELRAGETLSDAIRYAGGFVGNAYRKQLKVVRQTEREKQIFTLGEKDYGLFRMADGDAVTVDSNLTRYENMVVVEGAVYRPGEYELGNTIATVRQLIAHADGLTPDAFLGRAIIIREKEDLSLMTIAVDLKKLMNGEASDVLLQKNDMLVVSRVTELQDNGTMSIVGWVNQPGTFPYASNTTIEDLVVRAGGFKQGASTIRADVARRIYDPKSSASSSKLAHVYTMDFADGLALRDSGMFTLEPYDIVIVRRSPDYSEQQKVNVKGEVAFPGEYILTSANDRLSDIMKRAGGVTSFAYIKGSKLIRRTEASERSEIIDVMNNLRTDVNIDSLTILQTQRATYPVGVQLDHAVKRPYSDYDIILQDGDEIIVPRYDGTVRINGEVMRPNAVSYRSGKHARYYINQAGGYGLNAKKRQTFIVYPNGTVSRARWLTHIEPGCEIIVPQKPERSHMTTGERLALASATASMVSVVIALIRLFQ